jgi:polyether ionophore transport system permease protein
MSRTVTGARSLLRFLLRRERRSLPWWLGGATFLVAYQSVGSQSLYDSPEKLAQLQQTYGANAGMVAFSGPTELLATIGGEVVFEIFSFLAIIVGLMNMFLVGRNTRSEEEAGRAELIRSARIGRRAPLTAALALAGLSNVAVGLLVFGAAAATGLPVEGSVLLGLAITGVGLVFAALTAVAVQVFESGRAVYGSVGAAIGLAFLLRAAGDGGNDTLSWLSPIGWGQRTFPFVANRWWPLLLPLLFSAALTALAVALLDRRDIAAGLVASRPGKATAAWALGTPLGLALRLQRGSLIGWGIGMFVFGLAYGSFAESMQQFVEDNPEIANVFPGGAQNIVNGYLAFTTLALAIITAAYGITAALRARAEETSGRAEPVLATRMSRTTWLASHVTVAVAGSILVLAVAGLGQGIAYAAVASDPSQILRMVGVALVQAPAMCVIVAVAVLGFGLLPRIAAAAAWTLFGVCTFITLFGDAIDLPQALRDVSPFTHTPQAPLESVTAAPLVVIAAVAVVLLAGGFAGVRRRDIVSG